MYTVNSVHCTVHCTGAACLLLCLTGTVIVTNVNCLCYVLFTFITVYYVSFTVYQSADEWISRYPPLSYRSLAGSTLVYLADECIVRWLPPLAADLCGLLTIEHAWSRDHAASSVTAVLSPPGQHCGTVCLNSFGNQTSPSDNPNDR